MSITAIEATKVQTDAKKDYSQYDFANLEPYVHPPETKEDLPWSELVTLDLEDYARPGGKERLAKQLEHAFYVKNFGLTQEQIDQQFTLAKHFFELPVSEKEKYEINYAEADYNGWRRPGRSLVASARDNIEVFNIPKFIDDFKGKYNYPALLEAHIDEIEVFQRALHANVVLPLLRLFAIVLQLPDEDYLVKQHTYQKKSEDHFRYMIYYPRTDEEWAAAKNGATGGHTDLGTVTLLFRQPVAGLQILGDDGNWTWVQAQPGTITVNLADTISHLTGGWLKSSVHRVVAPPQDQREFKRTGLLYFARPHNDTKLLPITDSPVLEKEGVKPRFDKIVTMEEWVKAKQTLQLNPEIAAKRWAERGDGKVEVLAGFHDQKYKE
ncbi:Clavaminate synthase-like protein [Paraphaeosphaeria sporulosa]|uniref:Clavaminate synthase-like protein n=1 Tax=Paraphaeosphaeria sporulosa TaxID=1460663 RepID=A0A177CTL8_9PLEO|nr:Clavaminate synthase-like protein [Paraphaeosphaeria sporulosa]OAG10873.1 Clavaminate synthase-like protein [Paraphaeosphaeria sporulosa]